MLKSTIDGFVDDFMEWAMKETDLGDWHDLIIEQFKQALKNHCYKWFGKI